MAINFEFRRVGEKYFVVDGYNETLAVLGPEGLTAKPGIIAELDRVCPAHETLVEYIKRRAALGLGMPGPRTDGDGKGNGSPNGPQG
jgi:hypothetical protein